MKDEYIKPNMEVITCKDQDVLTASSDTWEGERDKKPFG